MRKVIVNPEIAKNPYDPEWVGDQISDEWGAGWNLPNEWWLSIPDDVKERYILKMWDEKPYATWSDPVEREMASRDPFYWWQISDQEKGIRRAFRMNLRNNPPDTSAKTDGFGGKGGKNFTIVASIDGEVLSFDTKFKTLKAEKFIEKQKPIPYAPNGKPVKKVSYIKEVPGHPEASGWLLPSTGTTYLDDEGNQYVEAELTYKNKDGQTVKKFEKTTSIEIQKFLPRGAEDGFVPDGRGFYEVFPSITKDNQKMWKFVKYMLDNNLIATGLVIFSKSWDKYGVLFIPYYDEDSNSYSLMARRTTSRLELKTIPVPTGEPEQAVEVKTGVEDLF